MTLEVPPRVLNKYKLLPGEVGVDISRNSPWGNPYPMKGPKDRDRVCDQFELYLQTLSRSFIVNAIAALKGHNLICFCKPCRCHGDTWLRVVNDETYLETHYPIITKLPRSTHMQTQEDILKDYHQLKELNNELVDAYQLTAPKIIKDKKLLEQSKYHRILKRYCTQLSIFNCALEEYESSSTCYFHQFYFNSSINEIATLEECHFKYSNLLELHVASLLFFNTLATRAALEEQATLKKNATLLDKFTPEEFHGIKVRLIQEDKVMMPGTTTSIKHFLEQYQALLEL